MKKYVSIPWAAGREEPSWLYLGIAEAKSVTSGTGTTKCFFYYWILLRSGMAELSQLNMGLAGLSQLHTRLAEQSQLQTRLAGLSQLQMGLAGLSKLQTRLVELS